MNQPTDVLDSSVAIDFATGVLPADVVADMEHRRFLAPNATRYEIGNFFRHAPHNGELTADRATVAAGLAFGLAVDYVDVPWTDAWALIGRLSWGDAEHAAVTLAVAERTLWTSDRKLAASQVIPDRQLRVIDRKK